MEIQTFMPNQSVVNDNSNIKKTNSVTLNEFQVNFHPNLMANIDTTNQKNIYYEL